MFASIRFLARARNLFIFAGKSINLGLSGPTVCWALSLVLCAKHGQKYHCSNVVFMDGKIISKLISIPAIHGF
jgi:hypothetical protein